MEWTVLVDVAYGLLGAGMIILAALVARRVGLPAPVLLVAVSILYAVLPGPNIALDSEVVLVLVLPPLLYSAALNSSLTGIRANLRTVISLSVLMIIATALLTGYLLAAVVPGLSFAAACALGAALAPMDPVSALSIGRRLGLPERLRTVIEGESLLNDATALTVYTVAVAALVGGGFDVPSVLGRFVLALAGGIAFGLAVAWIVGLVRRRLEEPVVETTLSLATPFLAYLPAEAFHSSGVLAVVVAGLVLGHRSRRLQSGPARLHAVAVWHLVDLLLEGFVFLLIGQQLPAVLHNIQKYPVSTVVAATTVTIASIVLLRPLWLLLPTLLPVRLRILSPHPNLNGRELTALSWTGMRGVISLAAVFALPPSAGSAPFPHHDLLLFCAYVTVLVTLVGQGLTFGPLLRWLGLRPDLGEDQRLRARARIAAADAGLRALESLQNRESVPEDIVERLRNIADIRRRRSEDILAALAVDTTANPAAESTSAVFGHVRRTMIEAERDELLLWRDTGNLPDSSLRLLENELDREEGALPPPVPRPPRHAETAPQS
nr:Na+/H+ antiporter [Protofrankia coriariae]